MNYEKLPDCIIRNRQRVRKPQLGAIRKLCKDKSAVFAVFALKKVSRSATAILRRISPRWQALHVPLFVDAQRAKSAKAISHKAQEISMNVMSARNLCCRTSARATFGKEGKGFSPASLLLQRTQLIVQSGLNVAIMIFVPLRSCLATEMIA